MSYQKDAAYNLYFRPGAEAFGYSEGAEAERRLLDIVESISDRSTFSDEYLERIVDWSTRYHFSRARHCLLRPLDIGPGERVLELGCGTGAITRYLGETGAQVTAVEGSLARARVAAARCHDLPNVTVIADDLQAVDVEGRYDWVTLIGVLEYAGAYSRAEEPWLAYLAAAMRHLKPGGRIVIAIENQLGLKYFNGCGEDHLGKPFVGIQDLYAPTGGVRTFGRKALGQVLERAGLTQQQWLYPYPDYKVPSVVLSDAALAHPDFNSADLLLRSFSEDYGGNDLRLFDEALVNRLLDDNGVLADFSNSFLVVASPAVQAAPAPQGEQAGSAAAQPARAGDKAGTEAGQGATPWQPAALAWSFAVHRKAGLCTETRFQPDDAGNGIMVRKCRLQPDAPRCVPLTTEQSLLLKAADSAYFPGQQLAWLLLRTHARTGATLDLIEGLLPWCQTLLTHAIPQVSPLGGCMPAAPESAVSGVVMVDVPSVQDASVDGKDRVSLLRDLSLPAECIDLVPFNILLNSAGQQQVIDLEWVASCPVPAGWVLTRGVLHVLRMGVVSGDELKALGRIIMTLAERCGHFATREDVEGWMLLEECFQRAVAAQPLPQLREALLRRPARLMRDVLHAQAAEITSLQAELHQSEEQRKLAAMQSADEHRQLLDCLSRIDQCQTRIRDLEHEVQTLLSSRSWRWSGWLRGLRRRVRI